MMPDGEPPEIWFYDNSRGACKLNITYCAYLDNVRITKGAHGWQYLFSDISLTEPGNTHLAGSVAETLDFLETALPDHDYTPLRTRLSSKTGKKPPPPDLTRPVESRPGACGHVVPESTRGVAVQEPRHPRS